MSDIFVFATQDLWRLGAMAVAGGLLVVLIISFRSRGRVFCQYLKLMTGIDLKPSQVNALYKSHGKAGVRDLLIDLIIQEDLSDPSRVVTPDSQPAPSIYDSNVFE
jgi:hypothetical protein